MTARERRIEGNDNVGGETRPPSSGPPAREALKAIAIVLPVVLVIYWAATTQARRPAHVAAPVVAPTPIPAPVRTGASALSPSSRPVLDHRDISSESEEKGKAPYREAMLGYVNAWTAMCNALTAKLTPVKNNPALLRDPRWQSQAAMPLGALIAVSRAMAQLKPVPKSMQGVHTLATQVEVESKTFADQFAHGVDQRDGAVMLGSLAHMINASVAVDKIDRTINPNRLR